MTKKNNKNKIGIIFIVIILALAIYLFKGNLSTLSVAQQVNGGTVLGVSYLQFFSNFNQLSGVPAYLVNLVVNNGGESLQGSMPSNYSTTSGSFVNNINSYSGTNYQASNPTQQINIDTKLNSLNESIPYDYAGFHLYKYYFNNETLSYSLPNAPPGLICNSGETNKQTFVGCYDFSGGVSTLAPTVSGFVQTLANDCQSEYTDGTLVVANTSTGFLQVLGVNLASALYYNVTCTQPYLGEIGIVLQPSTANYNYNVSVFFSNSTFTKTLYLSNQNPQTNYDNILYADVYGFENSGTGILSTTTAPTLIQFNNGTSIFVNDFSTATGLGEAYSQYTPAYETISASNLDLTPFGIENGAYVIQNAYPLNQLQGQINNNNKLVDNLLTPLQQSNPYSGIQYNSGSGDANINLLNNPPVYPEVQMIAKVQTLGVFQSITEPKIVSITPNPISFTSGAQAQIDITVQNQQNVAGSFYGSGYCGQTQFSIPNQNIGASGTDNVYVIIQAPPNPNLYNNEGVNCQATVYSSFGIFNSTYSFSGTVSPECAPGSIYQNQSTCKNEFPTTAGNTNSGCITGYEENSQGNCVVIPPICTVNETANYSTFPPHCNNPNGSSSQLNYLQIIEYIIIAIAIIAVIYILASSKNKGNNYKNYYRR